MDHPQSPGTGRSHPARQAVEGIFWLPWCLACDDDALFLLKVHGSSMIDAEIIDGDWAVVRQRPVAESGEIVAAVIDQEITIKRFKRINNQIWLMPENLAYIPIPGNEATILGKVVAVLRRFLLAVQAGSVS